MDLRRKIQFRLSFNDCLYLILFASSAVYIVLLFNFYRMPHNDFLQFVNPAQSFLKLQPPSSYKIMPAFPACIALIQLIWPGDPYFLRSTQIVIALSGIMLLVFGILLARRFLPWSGPLFVVFLAISPYFWEFTTQTLMEIFLTAGVMGSLWLFSKRSNYAFAMGGLVALTRYDAAFLIPAMGLTRFFEEGRKLRFLVFSFLSGLGMVLWLFVSFIHSPLVNPYVEEWAERSTSHAFRPLLRMLGQMLMGATPNGAELSRWQWSLFALIAIAITIGAWRLWRKDRGLTVVSATYVVAFFTIHALFIDAYYRYNYPIIPILLFYFFLAVEPTVGYDQPNRIPWWHWLYYFALSAAVFFLTRGYFQVTHVLLLWGPAIVVTGLFCLSRFTKVRFGPIRGGFAFITALACLWPQLSFWQRDYLEQKWRFSEMRAAAEWTAENLPADAKVIMMEPWLLIAHFPKSVSDRFIPVNSLSSTSGDGFVEECRALGIGYVIWCSSYQHCGRTVFWHKKLKSYLLNELGLGSAMPPAGFAKLATLQTGGGHRAEIYRILPGKYLMLEQILIDPNNELAARMLLKDGWTDHAEGDAGDRFFWAFGQSSSFDLIVQQITDDVKLIFSAAPFCPPGQPQQVICLTVNGISVGEIAMSAGDQTYCVQIPAGVLIAGRNNFRMEYRSHLRPIDFGINADERDLAVLFKRIHLVFRNK